MHTYITDISPVPRHVLGGVNEPPDVVVRPQAYPLWDSDVQDAHEPGGT